MPTKRNGSGGQQEYIPAGNGDPSGEYSNSEGSNRHFTSFEKPKTDTTVNIVVKDDNDSKNKNQQKLKTIDDTIAFVSDRSTFTKPSREKLKKILDSADDTSVSLLNNLYNKLVERNETVRFRHGRGVYKYYELLVEKADFENGGRFGIEGGVWFHENGHMFDNKMSDERYGYLSNTYKNADGETLQNICTKELQEWLSKGGAKAVLQKKSEYIEKEMKGFDSERFEELSEKHKVYSGERDKSVRDIWGKFYKGEINYDELNAQIKEIDKTYSQSESESEYEKLLDEKRSRELKGRNNFLCDYEAVSDLYSSSGVSYGFGLGHTAQYYRGGKNRAIELFANLFSQKAVNPNGYKITKEMFPLSVKMFEEIIDKYGK